MLKMLVMVIVTLAGVSPSFAAPKTMTPAQLQELKRSYRGNIVAGSIILPVGCAVGGIAIAVGALKSLGSSNNQYDSESEKKRKETRRREASLIGVGGAAVLGGSIITGIYYLRRGKAQKREYLLQSGDKQVQSERRRDAGIFFSSAEPVYQTDASSGRKQLGLSLNWQFD